MKVLLIDVNCKSGSTGKIVYDLYTELKKSGDEAAICYGRGKKVLEDNIYKFGCDWETYLHTFLMRLTGWTGCFSYFSTKRLIKFIDKFEPDVIHIHELHAYFVNVNMLLRYIAEKNIPVVHTLHCEFSYTGKCGYADDCEKWKESCGACPKVGGYPRSLCLDNTHSMFERKKDSFSKIRSLNIVTPSEWLEKRAKVSFFKDRKITVIHNGINTKCVFYPRDVGRLKTKYALTDEKIVLAVAPDLMGQRKGGRWVLKLAEKLKDDHVKFFLIGVTDLTENFPANVIALGRTENQQELAEYYSLADCFLICSEKENFPTTCIEAVCCGTPVVGFNVGGTAETVPNEYGLFVDYGDLDSLARGVQHFLAKKNNRVVISEYGKAEYSKAKMFSKYYSLYKETVN